MASTRGLDSGSSSTSDSYNTAHRVIELVRPAYRAARAVGYALLVFFLNFNGPLETNFLRKYRTDFHQIFRIGRATGGDDRSDIHFFDRSRDVAMVTKTGVVWYSSAAD